MAGKRPVITFKNISPLIDLKAVSSFVKLNVPEEVLVLSYAL